MAENAETDNKPESANAKKAEATNDNLVNGIVLEFSVQKQISDTDIRELKLPQNMHPIKEEKVEPTSNIIPISSVLGSYQQVQGANVELLVLEAQVKTVTTFITEAKILEIEMNKLIKAMYGKNPELKPYLLRMKKLLQDHANIDKALEATKVKASSSENSQAKKAS